MALPRSLTGSWTKRPTRRVEPEREDYELYEDDDGFVLSVEMPGFDREEIDVTWDDGVLDIAAEHEDEQRNRQRTYHRRFRFPKRVDDEEITARYSNGVLEIRLPVSEETAVPGREIEIQG